MAGRKRKCRICGEWIEDNNDSVPYKGGYVHRSCFNVAMKVVTTEKKKEVSRKADKPKPQKELKDGLSEEEYQEKRHLCDYVRSLIGEDLSVKIYKLIEDYKKKYKLSYSQMYDDLYWYFDLCGKPVEGDVVGIIPYCHTEAQQYYESTKASQASCQENLSKIPEMYKERSAAVSRERRVPIDQIDIAAIGGED